MERNKNKICTVRDIIDMIESVIPVQLQESWDNSGAQVISADSGVRKVLLAIDIDKRVVEEATAAGADMIVTHHPLMFDSVKRIDDSTSKGALICNVIRKGISVYSCHTPFDKIKGGNNDWIAELLGLTSVKNLAGESVDGPAKMIENRSDADIGRIGKLKEAVTVRQMLGRITAELDVSLREIRVAGDIDRIVKTVGVCTGAGADLVAMAKDSGCNMFVTGDLKYHEAQLADELNICIVDAGHYHTEKFFGKAFAAMMEKKLADKVEICLSKVDFDPFIML